MRLSPSARGGGGGGGGRRLETNLPPLYVSAADENETSEGYYAAFNLVRGNRDASGAYAHVIPFYFHSEDRDGDRFTLVPPLHYARDGAFHKDRFYLLSGLKQRGHRRDWYPLFPLLRYTDYEGAADRWEFGLFPVIEFIRDGDRRHLNLLDVMGLVNLMDLSLNVPAARIDKTAGEKASTEEGAMDYGLTEDGPGKDREGKPPNSIERGDALTLANILGVVELCRFSDLGGYDDVQLLTLLSSEKLSLFRYHWRKSGPERGATVLFPLYWHLADETCETYHFWPLYGRDRYSDGAYRDHLLYPCFSFGRSAGGTEWTLDFPWPLFRILRGDEGRSETRFLPLYLSMTDEESEFLACPPFYGGYESEESRLDAVTPLFFSYREKNEDYRFDLLFPLFAHFGYGEDDDTYSALPIFKVLADRPERMTPGRFQADLLWPLAGYGSSRERKVAWLFPLFNFDGDEKGVTWGFLADIFDIRLEEKKNTLTLFWFLPISWGGTDGDEEDEERES